MRVFWFGSIGEQTSSPWVILHLVKGTFYRHFQRKEEVDVRLMDSDAKSMEKCVISLLLL